MGEAGAGFFGRIVYGHPQPPLKTQTFGHGGGPIAPRNGSYAKRVGGGVDGEEWVGVLGVVTRLVGQQTLVNEQKLLERVYAFVAQRAVGGQAGNGEAKVECAGLGGGNK